MTERPTDTLLLVGKLLARLLQWVCGLAGACVVLLMPVVLLVSQGMLPGFAENSSDTIQASPATVLAIFAMLAAILAALSLFFGKLCAIIVSVGENDPFTPDNATRLNMMAWLFLGANILVLLVGGLRLHLANLLNKGTGNGDRLNFDLYDLDALVVVVVLFILARIFRHGAAMREDLQGTV